MSRGLLVEADALTRSTRCGHGQPPCAESVLPGKLYDPLFGILEFSGSTSVLLSSALLVASKSREVRLAVTRHGSPKLSAVSL